MAFGYNNVNGEFWAIVGDEPTYLHTFEEYGKRFDIEENFLEDQSNGFNVQKSEIRSVCALSRLWFILSRGDSLPHSSRDRGCGVGQAALGRPSLVSEQQLFPHWLRLGQNGFEEPMATDSTSLNWFIA
ncbi:hypothetical protein NDI52_33510 [Leptolyngbya sp. PL-A3]|uniref:hypothetical protein n=1 Tax=Leptolyngbya sp. PL-A3 TaxID=2933911 RepID=UPI0032989314